MHRAAILTFLPLFWFLAYVLVKILRLRRKNWFLVISVMALFAAFVGLIIHQARLYCSITGICTDLAHDLFFSFVLWGEILSFGAIVVFFGLRPLLKNGETKPSERHQGGQE